MLLGLISCVHVASEKATDFAPAKNYMVKFIAYYITGKLVQHLINRERMQRKTART